MNVALALFLLVFLIFGPAVVVLSFARIPFDRLLAGLPVYVYIVGVAVLLYVLADFFLMVKVLPGNPEQDGATFYFNNHGSRIPTDADGYLTGLMHQARLVSGHALIFLGIAALIAYQIEEIRSGRISLDVGPRDDALERSPLPYPLSRTVRLQTALAPEVCAERLLTFQPPSGWSFFGASRGLRGQASAEEFRMEVASPQSQLVYAVGRFERVGGAPSIHVLLPFKRWALISFAAMILLAPVAVAIVGSVGPPLPSFALALAFLVVVGANLLIGLDQRRRLLGQIKQAIDAQEIPAG
jgi:hypothetical protein